VTAAADLASDVTYLEAVSRAVADTSAKLVTDVTDLRARLEKLLLFVWRWKLQESSRLPARMLRQLWQRASLPILK